MVRLGHRAPDVDVVTIALDVADDLLNGEAWHAWYVRLRGSVGKGGVLFWSQVGCLTCFCGDDGGVVCFLWCQVALRISSKGAVEEASAAPRRPLCCWFRMACLRRKRKQLPYLLVELRPVPPCYIRGNPTDQ